MCSKTFAIHGHKQGITETFARFTEKLDLEPILLHERSNEGRTIIEKFSNYADVWSKAILITADDGEGLFSFPDARPAAADFWCLENE